MFNDKKIFILGMARSGYEAAKLLAPNNKVLITDRVEQEEDKVKELKDLGVNYVITNKQEDLLDESFDLLIKNPGVKLNNVVLKKADDLGIPIINEVELAYNYLPEDVSIIGITGSNGKTTTSSIIYELLKESGKRVHLAGNIGIPLCSFIPKIKKGDILVIEISSHQLVSFKNFKTNISILTNLSEVHLDFFGTYKYYKENKKRIFNHHTKDDLAIINLENQDSIDLTKDINSTKKYFSSLKKSDAYIKDNFIYYEDEKIINLDDIKIKGTHNYENIMCSIIAVKEYNVSNEVINKVLKSFKGVEHRTEYVKDVNGRHFYNDSKSTNTMSTKVALRTFNLPVILLLGGLDRGIPFDDLETELKHVKYIISYGETKNIIKEFADKRNIPSKITNNLEEATLKAYELSEEGDIILLSPACASLDQYKDFEVRGRHFKEIVENLK